jgi:hypothetical protein
MSSHHTEGRDTQNFFNASTRLSLPDFLEKAKAYLVNIAGALSVIRRANGVLHKWDSIWPDQCDIVAFSLQHIHQPTHDFAAFLSQTSHLPIAAISKNYQLVAELNYFEIQIQKLLLICQGQSQPLYRQRLELLQNIEEIICRGEEISRQIDTWLDFLSLQE